MIDEPEDRFTKIAYLHLADGSEVTDVADTLKQRGANPAETQVAISRAQFLLNELSAYRNKELLQTALGGVAVIAVGLVAMRFAADGPGRMGGLAFTVIALGVGIIVYSLWARSQPR